MSTAGKLAWGLVLVLAILHYDFWFWGDRSVMLGFMPVGLLYQVMISLGSAAAWALVVRHGWPQHIEAWADAGDSAEGRE